MYLHPSDQISVPCPFGFPSFISPMNLAPLGRMLVCWALERKTGNNRMLMIAVENRLHRFIVGSVRTGSNDACITDVDGLQNPVAVPAGRWGIPYPPHGHAWCKIQPLEGQPAPGTFRSRLRMWGISPSKTKVCQEKIKTMLASPLLLKTAVHTRSEKTHDVHTLPNDRLGFTLVEIMIVVAIIGLLAALAVPGFVKARMQSQGRRIMNDCRQQDAAIDQWAMETFQANGATVNTTGAATYLKTAWKTQDLLGKSFTLNGVGTGQILISTATKSALAGVGIDWGVY